VWNARQEATVIRVPETNADVIAEFRANGGEVTAPYDNPPPMLLLHTIGARSGKEHIVPMRGLPDGESLYVFASAHGNDRHPDWYYNLVTAGEGTVERGTETYRVTVREITGDARDRIYDEQTRRYPGFADYAKKTAGIRTIPVLELSHA
jgi:deazaflavin-dependent oxidoreductase (nitroreductase family)